MTYFLAKVSVGYCPRCTEYLELWHNLVVTDYLRHGIKVHILLQDPVLHMEEITKRLDEVLRNKLVELVPEFDELTKIKEYEICPHTEINYRLEELSGHDAMELAGRSPKRLHLYDFSDPNQYIETPLFCSFP